MSKILKIAIRGAGSANKGAETMQKSTIELLKARLPCEFIIDQWGPESGHQIDAIIDISGFSYSSHVPWRQVSLKAANKVKRAYPGVPWYFLPQSFGPFTGIQSACRQLFEGQHLYARDAISFAHLKRLRGCCEVTRGADVTWNFQGEVDAGRRILEALGLQLNQPIIGISPNIRIHERDKRYLGILKRIVSALANHAQVVAIPYEIRQTERADDRYLCQQLGVKTLAGNYSAEELKGVIAHLDFFAGSRFHALVAALSCGIPVIAFGWAHKYPELLREFGMAALNMDCELVNEARLVEAWTKRSELASRVTEISKLKKLGCDALFDDLAGKLSRIQTGLAAVM